MKFTEEQLANYFDYLDGLRESGATNMFGATAYLVKEYSIKTNVASQALMLWMQTFRRDKALGDRVDAAMEKQGDKGILKYE